MNMFPRNEHAFDRIARVVLGLGLLTIVFFGPRTAWGWLGLIPLLTGLIGSCPIYTLFGVSSCARKQGPAAQH